MGLCKFFANINVALHESGNVNAMREKHSIEDGDRPSCIPPASAGFSSRLVSTSIVFFSLMPNRAHDDFVGDDFKKDDVASAAEWNYQFAGSPIAQFCPTA